MSRNVNEYRDLSVEFIKRASSKTEDADVRHKLARMAVLVSVGRPLIESAKRAGYDEMTAHLMARQICHGVKQAFGRWGRGNGRIRQMIRNRRGGGGYQQPPAPQAAPQEAAPQEAAPQEAAPQEAAPQEAAPQEAAPQAQNPASLALQMAGGAARGSRNAQPSTRFSGADTESLRPSAPQITDADIASLAPSKPTGPNPRSLALQMAGGAARGSRNAQSPPAAMDANRPVPAPPQVANKPVTQPGVPTNRPPSSYNPAAPMGTGQRLGQAVDNQFVANGQLANRAIDATGQAFSNAGQGISNMANDAFVGVGNAANQAATNVGNNVQRVGNAASQLDFNNGATGFLGSLGSAAKSMFSPGGQPPSTTLPSPAPVRPAQAPKPAAPPSGMRMPRFNTPR